MSNDNDINELYKFMEGVLDYSIFPEVTPERLLTLKNLISENEQLEGKLKKSITLLDAAICPCCDKTGSYYNNDGEIYQCQWCCELVTVKDNE